MKRLPIHQNLSTSFVNLSALVRFLRGLQFVGSVRVELSSYEAEIFFTHTNQMQAREYDHIAGRISQGEHAFRRILVRAKEPFGRIHVFSVDREDSTEYVKKAFVDDRIAVRARGTVHGRGDRPVDNRLHRIKTADPIVIDLASELLRTIDESLAKAGLNFTEAFQNACTIVASEHRFLDSQATVFAYDNGRIKLNENVKLRKFIDGLAAALGHIFDRLRQDTGFGKLLIFTRHRIQTHMSSRRSDYDKYLLTARIIRLIT